jgi:hypothetical protein
MNNNSSRETQNEDTTKISTDSVMQNKKTFLKFFYQIPKLFRALVIIGFIAVVFIIGKGILNWCSKSDAITSDEVKTSITLTGTEDSSVLYTASINYEGIVEVPKDDDNSKSWHIYYNSTINGGYDINKIESSVDNGNKTITLTIPKIIYSTPAITDNETFEQNSDLTEGEIFSACEQDAQEKISKSTDFSDLAESNAKNTITALLTPITDKNGYQIKWIEPNSQE